MNAQWRLDAKAPSVASAFRGAAPEQRRRAALVACEAVVAIVGLEGHDDVNAGVIALREGHSNEALRARLSALAGRFDDEYFRLDEECDETKKAEVLRLFAKARGASALSFALTTDTAQLHEAIYEALSALIDDSSNVARTVDLVMAALTS